MRTPLVKIFHTHPQNTPEDENTTTETIVQRAGVPVKVDEGKVDEGNETAQRTGFQGKVGVKAGGRSEGKVEEGVCDKVGPQVKQRNPGKCVRAFPPLLPLAADV